MVKNLSTRPSTMDVSYWLGLGKAFMNFVKQSVALKINLWPLGVLRKDLPSLSVVQCKGSAVGCVCGMGWTSAWHWCRRRRPTAVQLHFGPLEPSSQYHKGLGHCRVPFSRLPFSGGRGEALDSCRGGRSTSADGSAPCWDLIMGPQELQVLSGPQHSWVSFLCASMCGLLPSCGRFSELSSRPPDESPGMPANCWWWPSAVAGGVNTGQWWP